MLEGGHRAGIKSELLIEPLHQMLGKYHIPYTKGRGDRFGEGVKVDDIVICRHGEECLDRLSEDRELGFVVIFYYQSVSFVSPSYVFMALGGRCGDTCREASEWRYMEDLGPGLVKGGTIDTFIFQGEQITGDS